jgi:hypothetical protein
MWTAPAAVALATILSGPQLVATLYCSRSSSTLGMESRWAFTGELFAYDAGNFTNANSIYKEIGPGKRIALSKLALEKFEDTGRPLRIAIDTSIWLFQIQASKGTQGRGCARSERR